MKKLSLVLAAALLLGGISFAQSSTTAKKAPAKTEKKSTAKKSTAKKASTKKASKTGTATPAGK